MINTLNESHLHKTLKKIYRLQNEGCEEECKAGPYIVDLKTKEGNIIEIQTGSLGHLLPKIRYFLGEKKKITVVYPLAAQRFIESTDPETGEKKRRRSPLHKSIYDIFRELTGLHEILLKTGFCLEVNLISMTEERKKTVNAVQSTNGRRRRLKNWIKTGKRLDEIQSTHIFKRKSDYLKLIPKTVPERFTLGELRQEIEKQGTKVKTESLRLMVWLYIKMGLMEKAEKKGRSNVYVLKR